MLLTTKFLRPTSDPRAVRRDRLSSLLEPDSPKRLNLLIAPAGFGKTTLVSQWCARNTLPTAWLSLDEHDDEPRRFWRYIAGAFEHAGLAGLDECVRQLSNHTGDDLSGAITALINLLSADASPWALILDDYHVIANSQIHRQVGYFLDYLPPDITVTLASRTEPPLPLSRWRVRRWVQDVHPGLLAFSEEECRQFFHTTMGMNLSEEDIRALCRRTEGWVAAMQLSALSSPRSGSGRHTGTAPVKLDVDERQISDYVVVGIG